MPDFSARLQHDLDERAGGHECLQVTLSAPVAGDALEERATLLGIADDTATARQIGRDLTLEMDGDARVGRHVGQPGARAGHTRDIEPAVEQEDDDLDALGFTRLPSRRGEVDDLAVAMVVRGSWMKAVMPAPRLVGCMSLVTLLPFIERGTSRAGRLPD